MDEFRIESKFCILIASHLILADAIPIIRITHDLVYLLFIEASSRLIDLSITPRIYICIRDEWNEWHCFQLPGPSIDIPYPSFTRVRFERIDHYRSANYDVIIIINAVFQRATAIDVRRQMSFYSTSRNYHSRNSSARKLYRRNIDVRLFKNDRKITCTRVYLRRRKKGRKKNRIDRDNFERISYDGK